MDKFYFKKSLGQNFLKDRNVIHKIVDSAKIDKNTLVMEVGPGGGALTGDIVPLCGYALLYEADGRLEGHLKKLLSCYDNYSLVFGDFLDVDLKSEISGYEFDKFYVVANLPYYITSPIIMKFINEDVLPDKFIIMIQKEVANRFVASYGSREYGSLTVFLNYFYDISKLFDVGRGCFNPVPNVDSSVICMKKKEERLKVNDYDLFKRVVRDSFSFKRKTIRNNLKKYDLDLVEKILVKYGYDLGVRAEQLSVNIFVDIVNGLAEK